MAGSRVDVCLPRRPHPVMQRWLGGAAVAACLSLTGAAGCSERSGAKEAPQTPQPDPRSSESQQGPTADPPAATRVPASAATALGSAAPGSIGRDGCQPLGAAERFELAPGGWFMSAVGLAVRFEGTSHDQLEDGRTALMLKLTLWDANGSTSWLPDVMAPPRFVPVLGRCVRLVDVAGDRAVIEVAPARRVGVSATAPPTAATCASPPSGVSQLTDYGSVRDGARYHVIVERHGQNGEWWPHRQPKMPHHHSSRLEWTNLVEHPELAAATSGRLRFSFELVSHKIEPVPSQHRWRAEYRARVESVCRP